MSDDKTLLIVEDDRPLRERLARAMEARGFTVAIAESVTEGKARAKEAPPAYAVVDLKLEDGNGLDVVETLHTIRPESRVVVLTGFGNIATAVAAVKYGAIDYLPKPADADDILAALMATPGGKPKPPENPMSADRVRWEHIQRVYELCGHNVSETARRLNMHRRTLQRILAKRSPRLPNSPWPGSARPSIAQRVAFFFILLSFSTDFFGRFFALFSAIRSSRAASKSFSVLRSSFASRARMTGKLL
jgi:two-component system response regulator RegA